MSMIIHKKNLPDIDIVQSSFVYDGNYILIQDEYICDVLKCMNVPEINDADFYVICGEHFINYPEALEPYAFKSTRNAYYYAKYALKGRFELGEKVIASNAKSSYMYACAVLNGRFELGETLIATNAEYSYLYAFAVLNDRFELGEHTILNSGFADFYREKFL